MKKAIYLAALNVLFVTGCGSKADGTYYIDTNATKASPEFVATNQKTNGGATMGLQIFAQLAETLTINGSKFRLVTLDCKLNSELSEAECTDQSKKSTSPKLIGFSLSNDIVKIDSGEGYPIFFKNQKAEVVPAQISNASTTPSIAKNYDNLEGIWIFSPEKSKTANPRSDQVEAAGVDGILMNVSAATANTAGIKIAGGQVQDGDSFCLLENDGDKEGFVSCVTPSDRSVYAKFMISSQGDLLMKIRAPTLSDLGVPTPGVVEIGKPLILVSSRKK